MKLLLSKTIKKLDVATIEMGTPQLNLIDNACNAFLQFIIPFLSKSQKIICICGTGNNGVDGLYITSKLASRGYLIEVACIEGQSKLSPQYLQAKENILKSKVSLATYTPSETVQGIKKCDIIIDGIFGSGLNRPLDKNYSRLIRHINSHNKKVFAIDIPSGMKAEGELNGDIVRCLGTLAFQFPRLSFFQREAAPYIGNWQYSSIGISDKLIQEEPAEHILIDKAHIKKILRERAIHSHKGSFGHTLLIGGSFGMAGAIILSARASMKIGSGKCTIMSFVESRVISQGCLLEASFQSIENPISNLQKLTVGIGPGLGRCEIAKNVLRNLIKDHKMPIVFDADALNILAVDTELFDLIPKDSILTPHTGEFHTLFGTLTSDYQRFQVQQKEAKERSIFIVLKGKHTTIACPDGEFYYNSTGNAGMATGGSGDVLTGIITGLLAQGYLSKEAAILGVYLHGLSGDYVTQEIGKMSLIASDIIDYIPRAISKVKS